MLTSLTFLEQLTLANNPMIAQPEEIRKQFDYRPYVINWCLSIRVLDGMLVGAKERWVGGETCSVIGVSRGLQSFAAHFHRSVGKLPV